MEIIKKIKRFIAIRFPFQKDATKRIVSFWEKGGADFDYFEAADQKKWLEVFWNPDSHFYSLFQHLNLDYTLEIACGTGRHSARVVDRIKHLYLLDSSAGALEIAKKKFAEYDNVSFIHNPGGYGISDKTIAPESLTAVFSYDAMVHFEKESVRSYIEDSYRVLKPGSFALFHHSNYDKNPNGTFTDNPGWRNFMTQSLFLSYAAACGFNVVRSEVISFSAEASDCITLLQKN